MLGMVGSSGWRLEMGSARHCLAAAARQLKVNMKKNSNRYARQLETNGVQGKKGGKDIECSHFILDLLPVFAFIALFFLPCSLQKAICFFAPLP